MCDERVDEALSFGSGQMLGDFQALHEIEAAAEIDRSCEVGGMKILGIDEHMAAIDVGPVDPHDIGAGFGPRPQPCALPAAEINDAAKRQSRRQARHYTSRRLQCEGRQKTVKVAIVFVQPDLLILRFFAPVAACTRHTSSAYAQ